ncbi:hypothetical protein PO856_004104 [Pectobacterium brasiliense]|uniref:ASCH domain-containing protein n=1 Tax=Pectobacterium brasiliense TaxID=180957 RepID=UPI002405E5BF|nr:ASCH domain-containing protein [Pectobacterium brasiliense]MDG0806815.1 hypothetical protein [Pectobacterium brasiliense]
MNKIILSVKPKYIKEILSGNKIIELRKMVGRSFLPDSEIYLYSSSPVKALVAKAHIKCVEKIDMHRVKERKSYILHAACITEGDFDDYFKASEFVFLIYLMKVNIFKNPLDLSELKNCGFTPPQSFCYVNERLNYFLESRGE